MELVEEKSLQGPLLLMYKKLTYYEQRKFSMEDLVQISHLALKVVRFHQENCFLLNILWRILEEVPHYYENFVNNYIDEVFLRNVLICRSIIATKKCVVMNVNPSDHPELATMKYLDPSSYHNQIMTNIDNELLLISKMKSYSEGVNKVSNFFPSEEDKIQFRWVLGDDLVWQNEMKRVFRLKREKFTCSRKTALDLNATKKIANKLKRKGSKLESESKDHVLEQILKCLWIYNLFSDEDLLKFPSFYDDLYTLYSIYSLFQIEDYHNFIKSKSCNHERVKLVAMYCTDIYSKFEQNFPAVIEITLNRFISHSLWVDMLINKFLRNETESILAYGTYSLPSLAPPCLIKLKPQNILGKNSLLDSIYKRTYGLKNVVSGIDQFCPCCRRDLKDNMKSIILPCLHAICEDCHIRMYQYRNFTGLMACITCKREVSFYIDRRDFESCMKVYKNYANLNKDENLFYASKNTVLKGGTVIFFIIGYLILLFTYIHTFWKIMLQKF